MTALLVLLSFYLSDVYRSEEARVMREANYIFVSAVDKARGDALEKILQYTDRDSVGDSISILAISQRDLGKEDIHSSLRIRMSADSGETVDVVGGINQIRRVENLLENKEGFKMKFLKDTQFTEEIDDVLKTRLKREGLNIRYEFMVQDSVNMWEDTSAIGLEEQFDFSVEQSPVTIIKKMWMEVLASLGVFLLVGLSFNFLEKSYKEQVSLNEARDHFVQNMTHELKSPVAAIGVALEAMESFGEKEEEQRKSYLKNSRLEIARLNGLIDKVMETSSIKNIGEAELRLETINLKDILIAITKRVGSAFPGNNIVFDTDGLTDADVRVNVLMLKGIFNNVLENAIKYSSGSKVEIGLNSIQKGSKVHVDIRDNGPGIDTEIAPYIFDRFYRGQKGNTYDVSGYGLGLSLARDYARAMGGELKLILKEKSEKYSGAHFRLILPKG